MKSPFGSVYLVAPKQCRLVKIGFTISGGANRLVVLQTGSPVTLYLVGELEGRRSDEHWAHKKLAKYRRHGEWFHVAGPVRQLVQLAAESGSIVSKTLWRPLLSRNRRSILETGEKPLSGGWFTEKMIAARLGLGLNLVRHWIRRGELKLVDRGLLANGKRRLHVSESDLLAFLQARANRVEKGS